jgi:hypothetical protein
MIRRLVFLLPVLAGATAAAQQAPVTRRLSAATGSLGAEFSSVSSIRELGDGRLLVVDNREQLVRVADFRTGGAEQVGRTGSGPEEYRNPSVLFALPSDTTLLPTTEFRWIVFVGATPVGTWGPAQTQRFLTRGVVFAVGGSGEVFSRVAGSASCHETPTDRPDTALVVRTSRSTLRADTLARLLVAPTMRRSKVLEGSLTTRCTPPVLPANDDVAAFADGSVAIARQSPYRVDWHDPRGALRTGGALASDFPTVTDRDRQAIIDSFPSRPRRMPDFDFDNFPARAPAFQAGALIPSPDGRLLIRRTLLASHTESRYDIVDRSSNLVAVLRMNRNQRVAGFGRGTIYVVTVDSDGPQRIARHPWP